MQVIWEVEDECAGNGKVHYTEVSDDELNKCKTEVEKTILMHDCIQDDFENKVSWHTL